MADYSDNILPLFTSASPIDGISITATPFITGFEGWRISTSSSNGWYPENNVSGKDRGVIIVDLGRKRKIGKYVFRSGNYFPKTWTVKGSDSGLFTGEEELLSMVMDSGANVSITTDKEFYIENPKSYRYFKFDITKSASGTFLQVLKMQLMEKLPVNKYLISSDDNDVVSIVLKASSGNQLIPKMSANTGNGIVLSGDDNPTFPLWQAFDRSGNPWLSNNTESASIIMRIDGNDKVPYSITVQGGSSTLAPVTWNFYGSNDGVTWSLLGSKSEDIGWINFETREFPLPNVNEAHSYYKFEVVKSQGETRKSVQEFNIIYASESSKVKYMKETERNFISHGMEKSNTIDLSKVFKKKVYIEQNSESIGSGKVFKKLIDTSKMSIKKVSIT